MTTKEQLCEEISSFCDKNFYNYNYFVCMYGSYSYGEFSDSSDLDIFMAIDNYDIDDFNKFKEFICNIHFSHKLKLDNEVPYENKLMILYQDLQDAINLKAFIKYEGKYFIPKIEKSEKFLMSREIKLRLILNALTTPHTFVCGNYNEYIKYKDFSEKSIIRLANKLVSVENPTNTELLDSLLFGLDKETGEMYLGYKKERLAVINYLSNIINKNNI